MALLKSSELDTFTPLNHSVQVSDVTREDTTHRLTGRITVQYTEGGSCLDG